MDSFDDFEFKPLTEGLGFHKKNSTNTQNLNDKNLPPLEPRSKVGEALGNLNLNSNTLSFDTPQFENKIELPELAPEISIFSKPLPRTAEDVVAKQTAIPPLQTTIPKFNPRFHKPLGNPAIQDNTSGLLGILNDSSLKSAELVKENIKTNRIDASPEVKFVEVAPTFLSIFLDFTVIAGLSILFLLGLVIATGLDVVPILSAAETGTLLGIGLLIYSVSQFYLILSRSFFGQTLGEWSMDTQLGMTKEQDTLAYMFKLIARTSVLAVSGFITLPIISMFLGMDLTGRATGLKLYRK